MRRCARRPGPRPDRQLGWRLGRRGGSLGRRSRRRPARPLGHRHQSRASRWRSAPCFRGATDRRPGSSACRATRSRRYVTFVLAVRPVLCGCRVRARWRRPIPMRADFAWPRPESGASSCACAATRAAASTCTATRARACSLDRPGRRPGPTTRPGQAVQPGDIVRYLRWRSCAMRLTLRYFASLRETLGPAARSTGPDAQPTAALRARWCARSRTPRQALAPGARCAWRRPGSLSTRGGAAARRRRGRLLPAGHRRLRRCAPRPHPGADFDVGAELAALQGGRTDVGAVAAFVGRVRGHTARTTCPR